MDPGIARVSPSPDNVDRISTLPDEILSHILSYLPTKYSVRTRILSTRWKYVFTIVPVLDFSCPFNCHTPSTVQLFLDFVDFVFNSYNVDRMERFVYSSSSFLPEFEGSRLISWIQDSVNRGVRELDVLEILNNSQTLPQNVLTSETLTALKLYGKFNLDVPDNVWLPNLRTLDLLNVTFLSDDSVRRLFGSCPVLEDLFLNSCRMQNIETLEICVPSLINLKIHGRKDKYELVLDVPNVKYFEFQAYDSRGFFTKNGLKFLVNASISLPIWSIVGFKALPKLFSIVSHVPRLQLGFSTLEAFERFGLTVPTFHNLTSLKMRMSACFDLDVGLLVELLDKTPHLNTLVLDNRCSSEFESDSVPEHVPVCVSTHLKVIEFQGFSMSVYECTLMKYFLKNAKNLHALHIQSREGLEKQFKMSKKLLTFSRCSRACQIIIDSVDLGRR